MSAEIECIGGGGGGGGPGAPGRRRNSTYGYVSYSGAGGGGAAAQKQKVHTHVNGVLRCYLGRGGGYGERGTPYSLTSSSDGGTGGGGGGGGGNGGISAVVQVSESQQTLLCCAVGGMGGSGGGGGQGSTAIEFGTPSAGNNYRKGGRGGSNGQAGESGYDDSGTTSSYAPGGAAGISGAGYLLSGYTISTINGGNAGYSTDTNLRNGSAGNGGAVFYPNSGSGGGGGSHNILGLKGNALTSYQEGETTTNQLLGGKGGPNIGTKYSTVTTGMGGCGGAVQFSDSSSAYGHGGSGGYIGDFVLLSTTPTYIWRFWYFWLYYY